MKSRLLILAIAVMCGACTSPSSAQRVLTDNGYTDIKAGGYGWFSCDEKDTFATKFTAKASNGRRVSGVVCAGWLKGNTIRFD